MSAHRILCLVVSVDRDATSLCRLTITNPLGVVEVSNKKGFWNPKTLAGGGYEIRTREGVNPTRFPSVRHRPLGESSMAAMNGAVAYVTLIKATRK